MEKTIPHDVAAENAILGAVMIDPSLYSLVSSLSPDDFYNEYNRFIFSVLPEYASSDDTGYVSLKNILEKKGFKDMQAIINHVFKIMDMVPSTDEQSVKTYMQYVKEKSYRRQRIKTLERSIQNLYNPTVEINKIDDDICNMIFNSEKQNMDNMISFEDAFNEFYDDLEKRKDKKERLAGISSGFKNWDIMCGGLEKQKLYVIGGRPAMGKTAFALSMAINIARFGKRVAFFSLEMGRKEIAKRITANVGKISSYVLKTANVQDEDYPKLGETLGIINDKIRINDNPVQTASGILSKCTRWNTENRKLKKNFDVIIIDYLQLLSNDNKRLDRRLSIGESSRMCKIMAKKLNCPVILLSQLSRASETRQDKMPILSDLREIGDIEQDADVVAFVHREEYYNQTTENRGKAEIKIAKNRDGAVGKFTLNWDSATTTFSDVFGGYDFGT